MKKRNEYPRPQFRREHWLNLNGEWAFSFDDKDKGMKERWYSGEHTFSEKINVPFVYQSEKSGIEEREPHDIVWYQRIFEVSVSKEQRVLLHFGAVDYEADIFINGHHACCHTGGHTSFELDITPFLTEDANQILTVRVYDPHGDESIPRGKQFWEAESRSIWYTNSTGIWQTVWLEIVSNTYLNKIKYTPLFDEGKIQLEAELNQGIETVLEYEISFQSLPVASGRADFIKQKLEFDIELIQNHIFRTNFHDDGWAWTPENPNLFDISLQLKSKTGELLDKIDSYFGLRKIHTEKGMTYLNNKPYYQKLVLDQGYWPEGLMTAPSDEDFIKDIELSKEMGFNGCRKHQKTEDPRFLYWADKLGFIVWGECAAAPVYTTKSAELLMKEWTEIIERDYNHPCIVTWVPLNESWGVPKIHRNRQQQHFSQGIYHYLHALDTTRLVISNDGWEMTETDICGIHNYAHGQHTEKEKYAFFKETLANTENLINRPSSPWSIYAQGFDYQGEPIILTEFGGIGYDVSGEPGWGYTSVNNEQEFLKDYYRIMEAIQASEALWGYCYTQLTDVEQEINGLLTYDRQPKCSLKEIKKINEQYHRNSIQN